MSLFSKRYEPKRIQPSKLQFRPLTAQVSAAAATAQDFHFDIPQNKFIHQILISIGETTTATATVRGTLADDLTDISLIVNGDQNIKVMKAPMAKQLSIMIEEKAMSTGYYKVFFVDPRFPETKPFPAFAKGITSLQLKLTDNAPAGSNYHQIRVSVLEEAYDGQDLSTYPILVEKYIKRQTWGANTGWLDYEHQRSHEVLGYLYALDDGETLEAPSESSGYDKIKITGRHPQGEDIILSEAWLLEQIELNTVQYGTALGTGYVAVEFMAGLDTKKYTELITQINQNTAATAGGMRVLERYLLR